MNEPNPCRDFILKLFAPKQPSMRAFNCLMPYCMHEGNEALQKLLESGDIKGLEKIRGIGKKTSREVMTSYKQGVK